MTTTAIPQLSLTMPIHSTKLPTQLPLALTPPVTPPSKLPWQDVAAHKQAERETILARYRDWRLTGDSVPPSTLKDVSNLMTSKLSPQEREIVESDATAIIENIKIRAWSAVQVLTAFCKAAVVAQDCINCLTEIFFEQGFARARELDEYLQRTGKTVGPLHGLPVSIKDHILVRGLDTSTGYISWVGETVAEKDAVVVDILRKAGAVLYCKTANPQTLLCLETNNNIFGRTVNPFNRDLSPGGSSGGESALVASFGSPMGVGTDIGGSVRIPAAFCGLYGLKGSVARMPHAGLLGSHDGMDNIVGCIGPVTRSARDMGLFCKVMLDSEAWLLEPAVFEIPWRTEIAAGQTLPKKLCYAFLWDDGVVKPHPPIIRELERTKAALLAAGHEVIDWEPLDHQEGWDLISKLYYLDAGEEYRRTIAEGGEPMVPGTEWMLTHAPKQGYTVPETWKLNLERERFRTQALQHWNKTQLRTSTGRPVDAIICPASSSLAVPHDGIRWWGYTSQWNVLDLPGVVFPAHGSPRMDPAEWTGVRMEGPRNDFERQVFDQWNAGCGEMYVGAPVALQIVGRRLNEEKVLAMLSVVEQATTEFYGKPSKTA